jgi:KDO2-lipid IV(A) lauroyltransferase
MLGALLRPLAWLPLRWVHGLGAGVGWLAYVCVRAYSARMRENLRQSRLFEDEEAYRRLLHAAIAEAGRSVLELGVIWFRSPERLRALAVDVRNRALFEAARQAGRGVLFLTPHMGCYEIASLYAGQFMPITVLYRRPRLAWLEPLMIAGRARGGVRLAPADFGGVRRLLRALRRGEAVGLLPDQVPTSGDGVWAPFFGRPAFTMTLANRLREATGCATILVFAERLAAGAGYRLHFNELPDSVHDEAGLNAAIEDIVRASPAQYLWSYNRYKVPRGVPPPDSGPGGIPC